MSDRPCFVCGRKSHIQRLANRTDWFVDCDLCGRYDIQDLAVESIGLPEDAPLLPYLVAYLRQAADARVDVRLTTDNWRAFAEAHRRTPMSRKLLRFMEQVGRTSPGDWLTPDPDLVMARMDVGSKAELELLTNHLAHAGYLRAATEGVPGTEDGHGGSRESRTRYQLTVVGWEWLEPRGGAGRPGTCFVAMSFDRSLDAAYDEGIRRAIETDCGLTAVRVDRQEHADSISDRILAGIRGSQFMVADFTLQRQGVYFEAGFAMGLGRLVIWTCREDDFANVHFDTRQFNHIVWKTPQDLREKLAARIGALVTLPTRQEPTR